MRTVWATLALAVCGFQPTGAQQPGPNLEVLSVYVTPADIQLIRQEPHGLLMQIPDRQLGRVNNIVVVLDSSGSPGSYFQRYRPNDPIYQNRPLPVLAAEFDEESLAQLHQSTLGMLFNVPSEAVSQITHVNLRMTRMSGASPTTSGGQSAPQQSGSNPPSNNSLSGTEFGMPPRQAPGGLSSANQQNSGQGWNMENRSGAASWERPQQDAPQPESTMPWTGNSLGGSGSNMSGGQWGTPTGNNNGPSGRSGFQDQPPPRLIDSTPTNDWNSTGGSLAPLGSRPATSGSQQGNAATWDPRYVGASPLSAGSQPGPYDRNQMVPTNQVPVYQDGGLSRREMEDRMALSQMRYYMENLENRVSQLTSELEFQQSRQRLERQREQAVEQASTAPMPPIQEASSKVPTTERAAAMDSSLPRINGFLWFMLLCSIGINLYLAWISRGFYMRYAELADELRETFTSSNP